MLNKSIIISHGYTFAPKFIIKRIIFLKKRRNMREKTVSSVASNPHRVGFLGLLVTLGIVFGDIGTSDRKSVGRERVC